MRYLIYVVLHFSRRTCPLVYLIYKLLYTSTPLLELLSDMFKLLQRRLPLAYDVFNFFEYQWHQWVPMSIQDRWCEFTPGRMFFQFFSCKQWKGVDHTQGWVQSGAKLTLSGNFSCKQAHSEHFGKGYLYFSRTPFLALDLSSICIWRPRPNLYLTGSALNLYLIDWYPDVAVVGLSDPSRKVWFSKIRLESKITEWTWK